MEEIPSRLLDSDSGRCSRASIFANGSGRATNGTSPNPSASPQFSVSADVSVRETMRAHNFSYGLDDGGGRALLGRMLPSTLAVSRSKYVVGPTCVRLLPLGVTDTTGRAGSRLERLATSEECDCFRDSPSFFAATKLTSIGLELPIPFLTKRAESRSWEDRSAISRGNGGDSSDSICCAHTCESGDGYPVMQGSGLALSSTICKSAVFPPCARR